MKKIFYTWKDVEGACLEIAKQILTSDWRPEYVVGVTRGGAIPAVLLSQYMSIPMRPLQVSLRDGGECVSDLGMAEDALGVVPSDEHHVWGNYKHLEKLKKKILIVDDINDQGSTIAWIKNDWPSGCFPNDPEWNNVWGNNVRFATLTNNLSSSQEVDYTVWEVNKAEEDCWLVYPWEDFWKNGK